MSKKPAKTASAAPAPKKRSTSKLAILALAPLLIAGGAYGGWTHYAGAAAGSGDGQDDIVAAVPLEIAAETSFTHSYALSVISTRQCGGIAVPALQAASQAEAHADGMLVNLSWVAAARRIDVLTKESCGMLRSEILAAEAKADRLAESIPEKAAHH